MLTDGYGVDSSNPDLSPMLEAGEGIEAAWTLLCYSQYLVAAGARGRRRVALQYSRLCLMS